MIVSSGVARLSWLPGLARLVNDPVANPGVYIIYALPSMVHTVAIAQINCTSINGTTDVLFSSDNHTG